MEEITRELKSLNIDIAVCTETKKKGTGTETINDYVHLFSGVPKYQRAKRGVSVLIHKKYHHKITDFESIDENIIRVNLNLNQMQVTLLGVYAISDDEPFAEKDEFFGKLNEEITKIGKTRELIIIGDLNSRTGCKNDDSVVGPYGELNQNDNGERLIEICQSHQFKILNGFYKHKDIHKYTWVQHTRNLKSIIDYVIIKQTTTLQVHDVRAYRGVTCGSDHYLVKAKMACPFRNTEKMEVNTQQLEETKIDTKQYNLDSLTHESTLTLYHRRLDEKLLDTTNQKSVDEIYKNIISSLQRAAEEALGVKTKTRNKNFWWNEEIEELIAKKKNLYKRWLTTKQPEDKEQYLEAKRATRHAVTTAKRKMWDMKCQEINTHLGGRRCSEAWKFIRNVKSAEEKNKNIQLIPTYKWMQHFEELLTENRDEYNTVTPTEVLVEGEAVYVTMTTVKKAIMQLKNGRATGPEGIAAELLKSGTNKLFELLTWCINQYLNGAPIPDEWKVAYISSIYKKGDKLNCSNYRGISVTSTLSRLYGRVLRDLIEIEYKEQEDEEQSGFRAGRTCTDNVFCLKQLIEKRSSTSQETHLMFIDLQKAYDTVPVKLLWKSLQETNINFTLIKALKNLYDGSTSRIKVGQRLSPEFSVNKGLRQGCCVSPTLFKIYVAKALHQWKRKCKGMGINMGDTCLYTLQFADDQVVIANDKDDLEYMTRKLQEEYKKWGLELNTQKTKYLPVGAEHPSNIQLDKEEIEICEEYTYLGVNFDTTGKDDKEIKKRITQARRTIGCLNGVLWSDHIGKKRKFTIYETLIKSSLIYGAETWRLTEQNKRKLEAVEMDVFRRTLGISRREKVRNTDIRQQMGVSGSVSTDIERQQLIWYGHVQRMDETRLPKIVMNWIPSNRRKRGRPRKTWKEGVAKAMSSRDLREGQWTDRTTWKLGIGQRRKTF